MKKKFFKHKIDIKCVVYDIENGVLKGMLLLLVRKSSFLGK